MKKKKKKFELSFVKANVIRKALFKATIKWKLSQLVKANQKESLTVQIPSIHMLIGSQKFFRALNLNDIEYDFENFTYIVLRANEVKKKKLRYK